MNASCKNASSVKLLGIQCSSSNGELGGSIMNGGVGGRAMIAFGGVEVYVMRVSVEWQVVGRMLARSRAM